MSQSIEVEGRFIWGPADGDGYVKAAGQAMFKIWHVPSKVERTPVWEISHPGAIVMTIERFDEAAADCLMVSDPLKFWICGKRAPSEGVFEVRIPRATPQHGGRVNFTLAATDECPGSLILKPVDAVEDHPVTCAQKSRRDFWGMAKISPPTIV